MKITIEVIPHNQQRYNTVGDWQFDHLGDLNIKVSELGSPQMNACVGVHEMWEALLCVDRGIPQELVDEFDLSFAGDGEPGDYFGCPYRKEHFAATTVERLLAAALKVNWEAYNHVINLISEEYDNGNETNPR